jgi:hypothetical protein
MHHWMLPCCVAEAVVIYLDCDAAGRFDQRRDSLAAAEYMILGEADFMCS